MKVWITKYVLTQGIFEAEAKVCENVNISMIEICRCDNKEYYHGNGREWHETEQSAIDMAEFMRHKKIISLKKQILKLENMKFNPSR